MKENELTTGLIIQHLSLESQTLYVSQFTAAIQIVSGLGVFGFDNHEFQVTACDRFLDCIVSFIVYVPLATPEIEYLALLPFTVVSYATSPDFIS